MDTKNQQPSYLCTDNNKTIKAAWLISELNAGPYNGMPKKVVGMYILLADDTEPGYDHLVVDNDQWP